MTARTALYTQEEFDEARAAYTREYGYDPCDDSDCFATGWQADGYHRARWWYHYPWKWTRPWLPRVGTGADEWCNDTFYVILPLLGGVTVRYRRGRLRGWADGGCARCEADMGFPSCPLCGRMHWKPCLPVAVYCSSCGLEMRSDAAGIRWRGSRLMCSMLCAGGTS